MEESKKPQTEFKTKKIIQRILTIITILIQKSTSKLDPKFKAVIKDEVELSKDLEFEMFAYTKNLIFFVKKGTPEKVYFINGKDNFKEENSLNLNSKIQHLIPIEDLVFAWIVMPNKPGKKEKFIYLKK